MSKTNKVKAVAGIIAWSVMTLGSVVAGFVIDQVFFGVAAGSIGSATIVRYVILQLTHDMLDLLSQEIDIHNE